MSVGAVNKQTGDRIPTAGMPAIDDALDLTSVNPVQNAIVTAALANKQDKTDNSLQTTDKTVVGAINEHEGDIDSLKSGLTNLTDVVGWGVDGGNVLIPSAGGSKNGVSYTRVYDQLGYVTKYDLSNATTSVNTAILPYRLPVKATSADYKVKYFNLPDGAGYMLWDDTTSSSISYGSGIITVPANHEVYIGIFIIDSGTDMSGKYLQVMATENTSDPMATYYPTRPVIGAAVEDHESRIEAVEAIVSSYTLTPATGVTLDRGSCIRTINTVTIDAVVTFTANKGKNNSIVSGMPAIGNNNIPMIAVAYSNGISTVRHVRLYNDAIMASEDFASGDTIHIMGTYTII